MTNKQYRKYIPELKKFIDEKGREYINLIAHKMMISERTVLRWYKQETRPSNAERMMLLRIIQGYKTSPK
jgi:DNA-binding transcriptional regulator YiaG